VRDVLRLQFANEALASKVGFFDIDDDPVTQPGYSMTDRGLRLTTQERTLFFCQRLQPVHRRPDSIQEDAIVIAGEHWRPTIEELNEMARAGYLRVVCSKIDQHRSEDWDDGMGGPDRVLPEFTHDLGKQGDLVLYLD
jgi:hypothetical protein